MSNTLCNITCGNFPCFPIFAGVRTTSSGSPPNVQTRTCYILQCGPPGSTPSYVLWRRQANGSQGQWQRLNINCPFVFYDTATELICLINFTSTSVPSSFSNPSNGPNIVVNPNTTGSVVGVTATQPTAASFGNTSGGVLFNQTTLTSGGGNSMPSMTTATATSPLVGASAVSTGNTSAGVLFNTTAPLGATTTASHLRLDNTSGNAVFGQTVGSTIHQGTLTVSGPTNPSRVAAGTLIRGLATNSSALSAADAGAHAYGQAANSSLIHADNDGTAAAGLSHDRSRILALGHGSLTHGQAGCCSTLQSGGPANLRNLPTKSRFRLAQVGAGSLINRNNIYAINRNGICPRRPFLVEDTVNDKTTPVLGCDICLESTGDHAPGVGHGTVTHGVAVDNSIVHSAGDGAAALGLAKCGEDHVAAGLGSFVQGRANVALGAYSHASGHGAITHMHAQYAQAIKGMPFANVDEACNICQYNRVITHSCAHCELILNTAGTMITGFRITYTLVLGDTPEDCIITTPDNETITLYKLPSLICPGVALVEIDVVSPAVTSSGTTIPGADLFTAKYCIAVTRTVMNGCSSHSVLPAPGTTLTPTCNIIGPAGATFATISTAADLPNNVCNGFSLQFSEVITVTPGTINPRVLSPPLTTANLTILPNGTFNTFTLLARVFCATFKYTEAPATFTKIKCASPPPRVITNVVREPINTFISATPIPCPTDPNVNSINQGSVVGVTSPTVSGGCCPQPQSGGQVFATSTDFGSEFNVGVNNQASLIDLSPLNILQGNNAQFFGGFSSN